jgi:hypothetical protein
LNQESNRADRSTAMQGATATVGYACIPPAADIDLMSWRVHAGYAEYVEHADYAEPTVFIVPTPTSAGPGLRPNDFPVLPFPMYDPPTRPAPCRVRQWMPGQVTGMAANRRRVGRDQKRVESNDEK